jgi:hypothetical protein
MKQSQNEKILCWLLDGNTLSPLQALEQFGCFRLAARIADLKREGHDIVTTIKEKYTEEGVVRYAEYHLRGK